MKVLLQFPVETDFAKYPVGLVPRAFLTVPYMQSKSGWVMEAEVEQNEPRTEVCRFHLLQTATNYAIPHNSEYVGSGRYATGMMEFETRVHFYRERQREA
jgi:hypothetical protein